MMTSSNRNVSRVTDLLCGEFTGDRWIPLTKTSDAEFWSFLWSAPCINNWVNTREAGDLRCHRAHYDVIVVIQEHGVVIASKRSLHCQPSVRKNHQPPVDSPRKGRVTGMRNKELWRFLCRLHEQTVELKSCRWFEAPWRSFDYGQ